MIKYYPLTDQMTDSFDEWLYRIVIKKNGRDYAEFGDCRLGEAQRNRP